MLTDDERVGRRECEGLGCYEMQAGSGSLFLAAAGSFAADLCALFLYTQIEVV